MSIRNILDSEDSAFIQKYETVMIRMGGAWAITSALNMSFNFYRDGNNVTITRGTLGNTPTVQNGVIKSLDRIPDLYIPKENVFIPIILRGNSTSMVSTMSIEDGYINIYNGPPPNTWGTGFNVGFFYPISINYSV